MLSNNDILVINRAVLKKNTWILDKQIECSATEPRKCLARTGVEQGLLSFDIKKKFT